MTMFENIMKLKHLYKLKSVYRSAPVNDRKESSAEHTFSAMMLADYLLSSYDFGVDYRKTLSLILCHDMVEIETGDIPIEDEKGRLTKKTEEMHGIRKLGRKLPKNYGSLLISRFEEFEEEKTPEAKFAKMIDSLDALMHFLDYKEAWEGWNEDMIRKFYDQRFCEFPQTKELFESILKYLKKEAYIPEKI